MTEAPVIENMESPRSSSFEYAYGELYPRKGSAVWKYNWSLKAMRLREQAETADNVKANKLLKRAAKCDWQAQRTNYSGKRKGK